MSGDSFNTPYYYGGEHLLAAHEAAVQECADYIGYKSILASFLGEMSDSMYGSAIPLKELNEKEKTHLQMAAEGYTYKEAAQALDLSPQTIKARRNKLIHKLGATTLPNLIRHS